MNPSSQQVDEDTTTIPENLGPKTWKVGTLTYTAGGLMALFFWLLFGDFAWAMRDRSVGPFCQWYLDSLGISALLFGLIFSSFPALIGLVLVPIISVKSDHHRGRWGRRIPFLLVTTPLTALGVVGLGLTPLVIEWASHIVSSDHATGRWLMEAWGNNATGAWILSVLRNEKTLAVIVFSVFWTIFEFASIASGAVFRGLINDVVPACMQGRFYGLFRAVSLIDAMIFNYWILGGVSSYFTLILVIVGIFYGLAFTLVCLKVKEGSYPKPIIPAQNLASPKLLPRYAKAFKTYFKECFSNPYYVMIFIMITAVSSSFLAVNVFFLPYAKNLGVSMDIYGKCLALTYVASLLLSYGLGWLSDRFHPMRTSIATLLGCTLVTAAGGLFATSVTSFLVILVLHGILCGSYLTTSASLMQRLFPRSNFAQFASAAHLMGAAAQMALAPAVGFLITMTGGTYRCTFVVAFALSLLALYLSFAVHQKFMALGGPTSYVAPE
ncbi:MAG: MFS transporter [Verrucomicrobia bacterium Tous-C9LFEB]|nr:MAG: MFS transporter [Verrucomicrobia bacterium Tous-C9LFEB]